MNARLGLAPVVHRWPRRILWCGASLCVHCTVSTVPPPELDLAPTPPREATQARENVAIDSSPSEVHPPNTTAILGENVETPAPLQARTFSLALDALPPTLVVAPNVMNAPLASCGPRRWRIARMAMRMVASHSADNAAFPRVSTW